MAMGFTTCCKQPVYFHQYKGPGMIGVVAVGQTLLTYARTSQDPRGHGLNIRVG